MPYTAPHHRLNPRPFCLGRPHSNKTLRNPAAAPQTVAVMRPPGACPELRNCLRHRYAKPPGPCVGLGWLGCLAQGWPGLDRPTPYPPAIYAYGARPQGGEGRRAPTYKPQRFREQKASCTGLPGLPKLRGLAWVGLFVLTVFS